MRLYLAFLLAMTSCLSYAQHTPQNAHKSPYTSGWQCNRGFQQVSQECQKVVIPKNASLDFLGNDWVCNRGFGRVGNECQKVVIPNNAGLDFLGNNWECNKGFQRVGAECQKVVIPANAVLDFLGHDWECKKGFKRIGSGCQTLTDNEKKLLAEQTKAIQQEINRRKTKGVNGNHCDVEYKSGANVCLTVRDASLRCSESYSGTYYDRCRVEVSYGSETDYRGGGYIDGQVRCEVTISASSGQGYASSKSQDEQRNISLFAFGSDSQSMDFSFSFSEYDAITNVRIRDVSCRLSDLFLY